MQAQNLLKLLPGSKELSFDEKTGKHRLIGSVNFEYQGNKMYCDSAHYFEKTNEVKAYGNVHINRRDTLNLFCDSLHYKGRTKKAMLWGHVRVRDNSFKLTTDSLEYDSANGVAVYRHGGKVESSLGSEVLTSKVGYFYPDSKNAFFKGDVFYKSDEMTMATDTLKYTYSTGTTHFYGPTSIVTQDENIFCESGWYNTDTEEGSLQKNAVIYQGSKIIKGDTLAYFPKKNLSIGRGNVYYRDTIDQVSMQGDYGVIDENKGTSLLTGRTLFSKVQQNDTLYLHADTLLSISDSLGKRLKTLAYPDAKLYNTDIQAKADSIVNLADSNLVLFHGSPIFWAKNAELKGDSMRCELGDSSVNYVLLQHHASVISEVDSGSYYNQIGGSQIHAYFKNNELIRSDVNGNAQTIFFPVNEEKSDSLTVVKRLGMNRLYASDLRVYLDSGEVTGITYFDHPDGVFYPIDQIKKEEQFLPNFAINPQLRPKSVEDLFKHEMVIEEREN